MDRRVGTTDGTALRLSASLLFVGEVVFIIAGLLHTAREDANNHPAVFAEYAQSKSWIAVHLGQFVGFALIAAGLVALFLSLDLRTDKRGWVASRIGAVSSAVTLGLYGVLQAVDGVALKHSVDAWFNAPASTKQADFGNAQAVRWLEWGLRSYENVMFGLTLLLLAAVVIWTAKLPKPIGFLAGVSGLAYLAQGWIVGSEGFAPTAQLFFVAPIVCDVVWIVWLVIFAWRIHARGEVKT
jgi:hypothetical protein